MHIRDQQGNLVDADLVEVVKASEPWSEYTLADGTTLKIKVVLGSTYRLRGQWTDDGDPVYVTKAQTVVMAIVPDDLKRGNDA